jgi:hypothetical protein
MWFGQVNGPGGSTGIAQGGTAMLLVCTEGILGGWSCPQTYQNWYEFFNPNKWEPYVTLPGTVNPGDLVDGLSEYNSTSHVYSEEVNDITQDRYDFASSPAGFMGPPDAGEFEVEDPAPQDGGPLPVEDFSSFIPQMADPLGHQYGCGVNCLLDLSHWKYTSIPVVSASAPFYGVKEGGQVNCQVYTCFNVSYS